jgi:hypothetical protein
MLEKETACPVKIAAYAALNERGWSLWVRRFHLKASRPQLKADKRVMKSKYQKAVATGICCTDTIKLGSCFCS